MNIDEAIRVLTVLQGAPVLEDDKLVVSGLHLGIEALKRHKLNKKRDYPTVYSLLKGETEE